jgi:molecular chaperone Hsp33
MLRSLGREEIESIIAEQGQVEVGCDFCGAMYRFDPIEAAQVFLQPAIQPPGSPGVH